MKRAELFLLIFCALFTFGVLAAHGSAVPLPWISQFDNDAQQMAGGKIYTYAAGTTTPKATYVDAAKSSTAANPLILDAYGRVTAYGDGVYKLVIKNSSDVTITTIDNVELVSTVNPTSISATNITVGSLTSTLVDLKGGWIYDVNLSNASMTATKMFNTFIMAAPTVASHPVNLLFMQTAIASQAAYDAASLATHTTDTSDPHGSTLTQTTLRATTLSGPTWVASDSTNYPGIGLLATGATLYGTSTNSELAFASVIGGTHQTSRVAINTWQADPPVLYLRMQGLTGWRNQITVDATGSGTVDFGGAALTNYSGMSGALEIYDATATTAVVYPNSGSSSVCLVLVPASFTAGIYEVVWELTSENNGDPASHFGNYSAYFSVNGTAYSVKYGYCGPNSSSVQALSQVGSKLFVTLSPSNVLAISGAQGTKVGNGVKSTSYRLNFRYLGATKKAL